MAYPNTAALVGASSVEALTSLTTPEQDSLRAAAIAAIERHCRQPFTLTSGTTRTLSGTGAMVIVLPQRLETLDSVTINGIASDVSALALSDDHSKLYFESLAGSNYYERTMRELDDDSTLAFANGVENVVITGDWGWATCPEAVATAIRYDMEDSAMAEQSELGPTIQAYRKLGLKAVVQGNLNVAIGTAPPVTDRVVNLLAGYVWHDPVGVVV